MRKNKICIIGNGVVIDPDILFHEMDLLTSLGVECTPNRLRIAKNAHIIFPFHKVIDENRENKSTSHIGTTKRGIGPCYEDKVARFGILAKDLQSKDILEKKLANTLMHRFLVDNEDRKASMMEELLTKMIPLGEKLAPFLCDAGDQLHSLLKEGRRILFEGAQGTLLDVDHGTYPFVTSSNCVAAFASIGSGVGHQFLNEVMLVTKAYCTRVGEGPFFTEGNAFEQEHFRTLGHEFGATTGRPRRCGWLDVPALKYASRINGATGLVVTKVDILAGFDHVKIGMSYSIGNRQGLTFLEAMEHHGRGEKITVDYNELPAVGPMPEKINSLADLPKTIRDLIAVLEKALDIPVRIVSYGQKRGSELFLA